ncbi:MAG: hypothetical protein APF82_00960 [Sphingomonadales bacterium BRH_c42]|nr:MAG: hypothetical protein APF82_00960 [Sphingomonadales bacterium BRH_c42]
MPYTLGALYNEGEVAGFDEAISDDLIKRSIAEAVKPAKGKAADEEAAKKAAEEAAAKKAAEDEAAKKAADEKADAKKA